MGSMSVSSCRCCMFVSCVHPVEVLNAEFCMTCSLLMLVKDARDDHMEEAYKPDWRCTIHTPTQNVTTTPSTDNTTPHHNQTTTHPLTNNNQSKDKNIVILKININDIRNKIEELKKLVHSTQPDIITYKKQNSHRKLTHLKYPTTPPYAQTQSTNKEGDSLH